MPTALPVSSAVNTFMQAADEAAERSALQLQGTGYCMPLVIYFKNIAVGTSGSPQDLATVDLPAWCTRYLVLPSSVNRLYAESAAGTLAAANFYVYTAAGGGGISLTTSASGPASTSVNVQVSGVGTGIVPQTASRLYLRQQADSANAGTISMYLLLLPCL